MSKRNYETIQEFRGLNFTDENTQIGLEDMLRYDQAEFVTAHINKYGLGTFSVSVKTTSRMKYYKGLTIDRWMSFGFIPVQS